MDAGGAKSGVAGLFPELPGRMRRPAVFALLFWGVLILIGASYAFDLERGEAGLGFVPTVFGVAALVVAWFALPWDPRASGLRKLAAPVFLLCALGVGVLSGSVWAMGLYAVSLANGVFLFGFGRGIAFAAAVLPVVFVNYLQLLGTLYPTGGAVPDALQLTAAWVPVAAFVIGVCAAIAEAVRRREEAQLLLAELETAHLELAAAHRELERNAEKRRELAVARAVAEERARMAREIHDSVGHHLTVVNLQLENASRLEKTNPRRAREQLTQAKRFTLEALSEVRRSVRALKPPALEGDCAGALAALVRSFDGAGSEVRFAVEGEERELPEGVALALYRALQEGLTNASRHSGAHRVRATLSFEEGRVGLAVADDGAGSPDGSPDGTENGFGLAALRERAEALGGAVRFGNAEAGGFVLEVELPAKMPNGTSP